MAKAWQLFRGEPAEGDAASPGLLPPDWHGRMSDNIAFALLTYTGLQIAVTTASLHAGGNGLSPYLALVLLVGAVIPACCRCEQRWSRLDGGEGGELAAAFQRDRRWLWGLAVVLPFALTGALGLAGLVLG